MMRSGHSLSCWREQALHRNIVRQGCSWLRQLDGLRVELGEKIRARSLACGHGWDENGRKSTEGRESEWVSERERKRVRKRLFRWAKRVRRWRRQAQKKNTVDCEAFEEDEEEGRYWPVITTSHKNQNGEFYETLGLPSEY